MIFGSLEARDGSLAGPEWLLVTYVVYTWGELCLSPVGLSMVTRLAPARLQSLMMGLWFFSFSLANLFGGLVARFSKRLESGELSFVLDGLPGFYLMLVVFPIAAGLVILLLTPLLKRMMHGAS
jgi:POT family proton-dependent oligopeptide transporter